MASITRYRGGWRAHVYVQGVRASKLFRTRPEAYAWAARKESEMVGGSALTFGAAAERFLHWKLPTLENAANQRAYEQSIRDYALPALAERRLADITRKELVAVVRAVADQGLVETSHRVGQRIRAIFDFAVDSGDIESHPAAGLSRVLPAAEKQKQPAITPAELPDLMRAIVSYPEPVTQIGLLLMAHTFLRTSELIGCRWDEIRDDVIVVPAERMKGKKNKRLPHVVPLSPIVRGMLKQLEAMTGDSPFLLASPVNPLVPISKNTLLFALYRLGYRGRMSGHGFRAVASTFLNESGLWHYDAVERQLAHKETDKVRDAYHRAEYLDERRRMMDWYSQRLAAMASTTAE